MNVFRKHSTFRFPACVFKLLTFFQSEECYQLESAFKKQKI